MDGASVMIVRLRPLSRQEVRGLDERAAAELALPTLLLMENAGGGAAGWLAELAGAIPPDAGGRPFTPRPPCPTRTSRTGRRRPGC